MTQNPRRIKAFLQFFAVLAILVGVGSAAYAWFGLRPKLSVLTGQVTERLQEADQALVAAQKNVGLIASSLGGVQSVNQIVGLLPETLVALKGTLLQTSDTLYSTATTTKKVKGSVTGVLLPHTSLGLDATMLRKSADQVRLLAAMVEGLSAASTHLAQSSSSLSSQLGQFQNPIQEIRNRIHSSLDAIQSVNLPMHAALLGLSLSGLFIFAGLLLFGLAQIYEQVATIHMAIAPRARDIPRQAA